MQVQEQLFGHSRYSVSWPGRVFYSNTDFQRARFLEISKGGASLTQATTLPINEAVILEFYVGYRGEQVRILGKALVTDCEQLDNGSGFKITAKYIQITKENLHTLGNILQLMEFE